MINILQIVAGLFCLILAIVFWEQALVILAVGVAIALVKYFFESRETKNQHQRAEAMIEDMRTYMQRLGKVCGEYFAVRCCSHCGEAKMKVNKVNAGATKIEYECRFCGKKAYAPAVSPNATQAKHLSALLARQVKAYKNSDCCVIKVDLDEAFFTVVDVKNQTAGT